MTGEVGHIFEAAGAVLHGHFLLTSGRHSPVYWEKFKVLQQPAYTVRLCHMIAEHYRPRNVQVVAGPTTGGVVLAYEVARQLDIRAAFAEKGESGRSFRRGITLSPGDRVLVVDDILTTGSSVREVIKAVDQAQATIVGIGVLVDRSDKDLEFGYPLFACLRSPALSYAPEECPQCRDGLPLTRPGGI